MANTHSHGTYGWHDHPTFDSTGDHVASHDADQQAKLIKFFDGATWHPLAGITWPAKPFPQGWADSSEAHSDVKFEHRKA